MQATDGGVPQVGKWKFLPWAAVWLALRIYASVGALLFSSVRPLTPTEQLIAVWPPAANIGLWLYRLLLAPWLRWDAVWYWTILVSGQVAGNGSTNFHPLYDILSRPLYWLGLEPLLSLMITSSVAALGFFWIFYRYAGLDLPREGRVLALLLLTTFPAALILFAPYSEGVFLFFSTLALFEMRRRRWLSAALATLAASLTRQQGILLIFPMLWQAWEDSGRSVQGIVKTWRGWLAAISAPLGLLIWTAVRIGYLHDGTLEARTWQGFFYSALLSPSSKAVVPDQAMLWPWDAFAAIVPRLLHGPDLEDVMSVGLGLAFVVLLALAWKAMRPGERLYSLAITLTSFSYFTGPGRVYLGLPRHLLLAVPVFVGLAATLQKRWQRLGVVGVQVLLQIFMLLLYVTNLWIP